MAKNISVADIAARAGVSVATVSRIINQKSGKFSSDTEEKVLKIIEELHYQPNQLARSLRTMKADTIGIMVPDITNEFFARVTLEIQRNLFLQGFVSIIFNTNEDPQIEKQELESLLQRRVSGVIFISGSTPANILGNIPAIFIDRKPDQEQIVGKYEFIDSDNVSGGEMAAGKMLEKGCTHFACVSYKSKASTHTERVSGYKKALKSAGIKSADIIHLSVDRVSIENGYEATKKILEKNPEINGIFFTSDLLAVGAVKATQEIGLQIPKDIKIIGFDDISAATIISPALTTIHQDVSEIAKEASKAMIEMINRNEEFGNETHIPVRLIERETC